MSSPNVFRNSWACGAESPRSPAPPRKSRRTRGRRRGSHWHAQPSRSLDIPRPPIACGVAAVSGFDGPTTTRNYITVAFGFEKRYLYHFLYLFKGYWYLLITSNWSAGIPPKLRESLSGAGNWAKPRKARPHDHTQHHPLSTVSKFQLPDARTFHARGGCLCPHITSSLLPTSTPPLSPPATTLPPPPPPIRPPPSPPWLPRRSVVAATKCGVAEWRTAGQPLQEEPYTPRSQPQAPTCPHTLHAARSSRTYPPNTSPAQFHPPHPGYHAPPQSINHRRPPGLLISLIR